MGGCKSTPLEEKKPKEARWLNLASGRKPQTLEPQREKGSYQSRFVGILRGYSSSRLLPSPAEAVQAADQQALQAARNEKLQLIAQLEEKLATIEEKLTEAQRHYLLTGEETQVYAVAARADWCTDWLIAALRWPPSRMRYRNSGHGSRSSKGSSS